MDPKWKAWLDSLNWTSVCGSEFQSLTSDDQLIRIRHSAAHLLAQVIQKLYPHTRFATGPATVEGFFYDIQLTPALKPEDLEKINTELEKTIQEKQSFSWTRISKEKAIEFFQCMGQTLKLEIISKIDSNELTLYRNGDFVDLCAGPHVPHSGWCQATRILHCAAAHWKKDEKIPSLTRVYGTAWHHPKELRQYLELTQEIKKRDHRVLGPELELFSFHHWAASALWYPKGLILRNELLKLWRESISSHRYLEILNPLLYRKELFECSGHWEHFRENMFIFNEEEKANSPFILKPMNCPDTMLFYKTKIRSYRELPLRVAEGQILHRNEATGSLHGIMRTRNFIQDDAHIFLTSEQIQEEVHSILHILDHLYKQFGLKYEVHLSTMPEKYLGSAEVWEKAETALKEALKKAQLPFQMDPGEGAFYGPKIDIMILDSLGRNWQCGTIQLDFQLPERFDLLYSAEDGSLKRPIVIHRAIFGSLERFIGILIEHFGGAFPTWLSPIQAIILPISEKHLDYAQEIDQALCTQGIRGEVWSEESVNKRVRLAQISKIPYILVCGDREQKENQLTVRRYGSKEQKTIDTKALLTEIKQKIQTRELDITVKDYAEFFKSRRHITTENQAY